LLGHDTLSLVLPVPRSVGPLSASPIVTRQRLLSCPFDAISTLGVVRLVNTHAAGDRHHEPTILSPLTAQSQSLLRTPP